MGRSTKIVVSLSIVVLGLFFSFVIYTSNQPSGSAMIFFNELFKQQEVDAVLFSGVSGTILFNGTPVPNAELDFSVRWNDEEITQTYTTDANGRFVIPKIERRIKTSPLVQLVISQSIVARYQGEDYSIWIKGKRDTEEFSELGGKPINFRCELTAPLKRIELESGALGTPGEWDGVEIP
ncbi:carboxypeptidase-like regulatory domain-containing protein [Fodinibius salsisoli]|uniref:Carboxypeptidase regulatory-like domain-containing protein n=1 Tax=Fodinibius salsisoli TaxID=2820877 RepID=A0ABT3PJA6_9BACT|nr:carboxypeptidase-like regulatory domain-containing protein [Fodinibius salsisoli]MCW9706020.1 carboxypeptidase regulatory-like domain-containing protein [Fodinibius salsisoli]